MPTDLELRRAHAVLMAIASLAETVSFDRLKLNPHTGETLSEDKAMTEIFTIAHAYTAPADCGCNATSWKQAGEELCDEFGVPWPEEEV